MKPQILLALACSLPCLGLWGKEGSNLIINGDFSDIVDGRANYWISSPSNYSAFHETGGPEGKSYLSMLPAEDMAYENKVRVKYLTLVPGEEYRLSAMVRTRNLAAKMASVIVIDNGWFRSEGLDGLPPNTQGWRKIEKNIKCPDSSDTTKYDLVIITIGQTGYLDVTDVELVPLTEKAIAQSKPTPARPIGNQGRMIPWSPCFNEVPLYRPQVSFVWYGKLDRDFKAADYQVQASVPAVGYKGPKQDFASGQPFEVALAGIPAGIQKLTMQVLGKADGKVAFEETFLVNLRNLPPPEETTIGKRLNNFTVELVNQQVAADEAVPFILGHDTWMYFTLKNQVKADFTMTLDGKKLDDCVTGLPESFRFVEAGRHVLSADCSGTFIARTIAELFSCGMLEGPRVTEFPAYGWEFAKKWALPALTHCNRGNPSEEILKQIHDSGRIWTGNLNAVNPPTVEEMHKRMDNTLPKLGARDGVTADELFYTTPEMDNYTQALKANSYDRSKLVYTWGCGEPGLMSSHTDFIATVMNASRGRGKLLREAYIRGNQLDEEAAFKQAENEMATYFKISKRFYPDFARRAGIILGNFNQLNVITLEHRPEIDYKYYLDMQMNILANNPVFEGISITGYWGTHYSDEEMYRWSHELLRHYVVEGKRDMLSKQYGFHYRPDHIANNDFADGLKGWQVEAAAEGSVSTGYMSGYNVKNQDRYGGAGEVGNTFCTLKRLEGAPNRISQVAKELVPGKQYLLLFSVGDYDDLKIQKFAPRSLGLDVTIENVTIDESFVFVDQREKGNYAHNNNIARQNLHRIVFTAKAAEAKITFTDVMAKPGETLMFNYVQLKPFFPRIR